MDALENCEGAGASAALKKRAHLTTRGHWAESGPPNPAQRAQIFLSLRLLGVCSLACWVLSLMPSMLTLIVVAAGFGALIAMWPPLRRR